MLIWVNGPFGGGKTQTAHEIGRRLPGSVICDPEEVGFGLHRMAPPSLRADFQDLPAWRQGVYEVLDLALAQAGLTLTPNTDGRVRDRLRRAWVGVKHIRFD